MISYQIIPIIVINPFMSNARIYVIRLFCIKFFSDTRQLSSIQMLAQVLILMIPYSLREN